jgi:hypothetical protein
MGTLLILLASMDLPGMADPGLDGWELCMQTMLSNSRKDNAALKLKRQRLGEDMQQALDHKCSTRHTAP